MRGDRDLADLGAQAFQAPRGGHDLIVHHLLAGGEPEVLEARLSEALLDQADLHALDAALQRRAIIAHVVPSG